MKKTGKRGVWKSALSMLLICGLCIGIVDVTAFAEEEASGVCGENLTWTLDMDGTLTISGTGEMTDRAFAQNLKIKKAVIENDVTSIGDYAFLGCTNLRSVEINGTDVTIGENALGIVYYEIYPGGERIKKKTGFVIYGNTGSTAETYATENDFTFAKIGTHVHAYEEADFAWTKTSDGYTVTATLTCPDDGDVRTVDCSVTCEIKEAACIEDGALTYTAETTANCDTYSDTKVIVLPAVGQWTLDSNGTLTISGAAKMGNCAMLNPGEADQPWNADDVKQVVIKEGVTDIGNRVFQNCKNLSSATIPSTVTAIGDRAFEDCANLKHATIPAAVTSIGYCAFYGCESLEEITIPSGVKTVGLGAFERCEEVSEIIIPSGIERIDDWAFATGSKLTGVTIESDNVSIGSQAFGYYFDESYYLENTTLKKKDDFVICAHVGSTAEQYAKDNGFAFQELVTIPERIESDNAKQSDDTQKPDRTQQTDDTYTKTNANIASIDTAKGTAQVADLVAGTNSEVPLAVVIEGSVYRMYNPNTGEHFYTKSSAERDYLIGSGWNYEENASFATIAADEEGARPVYRVYNSNSGLHHYTMNHEEAIMLSNVGWNYEGISFYAFDKDSGIGSEQYRLYNPNDGQHHWTVDSNERDSLVSLGWNAEGTAWRVK